MSFFKSEGGFLKGEGGFAKDANCCCCAVLPDDLSVAVNMDFCPCLPENPTHVFTWIDGSTGVYTVTRTDPTTWVGSGSVIFSVYERESTYPDCDGEIANTLDGSLTLDITVTCAPTTGVLSVTINEDGDTVFEGSGVLGAEITNTLSLTCDGTAWLRNPAGSFVTISA